MASPRRHRHRHDPRSPAAAPLEDDDLLSEILLRLSPQPSSLPRASLVCKRWRRLVSDHGFLRRFRRHHRRNPPILGYFVENGLPVRDICFKPALEPPNRVPVSRFSLQFNYDERMRLLNCRHGLLLIFFWMRNQVLVWDPINGDQHRVAVPPGLDVVVATRIEGAVLRAAGDTHHFKVVLVGTDEQQHTRGIARVYSSEAGEWSNVISTLLPFEASMSSFETLIYESTACVLIGNSLYWFLSENSPGILEFDLDTQILTVIHVPVGIYADSNCQFSVMRTEGGGLGFLFLSDFNAQLWNSKKDCDGVVSWVLRRTIELDKLLSLDPEIKRLPLLIRGFAEDSNVLYLWTSIGVFMVQLESLQFNKLSKTKYLPYCHPFESVYTADIGGEHDRAELFDQYARSGHA